MRRTAGLAVLPALLAATLPVAPASACSPAIGQLDLDRTKVVAGSSVRVAGQHDDRPFTCDMTPPTPSPTPEPEASLATREPEEPPLAVLSSLVPVAYASAAVEIDLVRAADYFAEGEGPSRTIGTGSATAAKDPYDPRYDVWRFATRVTLPSDVAPGTYRLSAYGQGRFYGFGLVEVVASLPDTGSASRDLAVLGLLLVLSGTTAVVAGRRATG